MAFLITGGAGFIGQHLARKFNNQINEEIVLVDRNLSSVQHDVLINNVLIETDVTDYEKMQQIIQRYSVNRIIHLAANSDIRNGESNSNPDFSDTLNTTLVLAELIKYSGIQQVFFASSSAIFGERSQKINQIDNQAKLPISFYGKAKLASEAVLAKVTNDCNVNYQCIRFPNVTGPNLTHGLIYDLVQKVRKNPTELNILGNGYQSKPFIHVQDLTSVIFDIFMSECQIVENLSPPDNITVREIVELTCKIFRIAPKVIYEKKAIGWMGDVPYYSYEKSKNSIVSKTKLRSSRKAVIDTLSEIVGTG